MAPQCGLCNNFQREQNQYRVAFDCKVDRFRDAARQGCLICASISEAIAHFEPKFGGLDKIRRVYVWGQIVGGRNEDNVFEIDVCLEDDRKVMLELFVADADPTQPMAPAKTMPTIPEDTSSDQTQPMAPMKVMPTIPGDTSSDQSFRWVVQRLRACAKHHRQCPEKKKVELPTRVLDLGRPGEGEDVKLLETPNRRGTYACLSHCWGKARSCITLHSNLHSRLDRIAWASLPPTFQDAVIFTRRLGLRYLWIDSLCIVQDDPMDWKRESGEMASIYRNAHITLAATKSPDSYGGCFSAVPPIDRDHELSRSPPSSGPRVFVREKIRHLEHASRSGSVDDSSPPEFPLPTRAWAYQERLLSPRVLHFCRRELVWECQQYRDCECRYSRPRLELQKREHAPSFWEPPKEYASFFPSPDEGQPGRPPAVKLDTSLATKRSRDGTIARTEGEHSAVPSVKALKNAAAKAKGQMRRGLEAMRSLRLGEKGAQPRMAPQIARGELDSVVQRYLKAEIEIRPADGEAAERAEAETRLWHRLVTQYSSLCLTKQSDRLPAIAGLARQMSELRGGGANYLAGIWRPSLGSDLLWRVDEPLTGRSAGRPNPLSAPSWSWASVNGKVHFWDKEPFADHSLTILDSRCDPVHCGRDKPDPFGQVAGGRLVVSADGLDAGKLVHAPADGETSTSLGVIGFMVARGGVEMPLLADYDLSRQGYGHVENGETVYCLGKFRCRTFSISLLLRCLNPRKLVFERIGAVVVPDEDVKELGLSFKAREITEGGIGNGPVKISIV